MHGRSAFTLAEFVVAIGIVVTLAAMSAGGIAKAAGRSRAVACLNNLRQNGTAALLYAAESDGSLPRSQHQGESWVGKLQPYLGSRTRTYRCPIDPNRKRLYSYAINDYLTPHPYGAEELDYSRLQNLPTPTATLLMAECHDKYVSSDHFHFADGDVGHGAGAFAGQVAVTRHGGLANYLFADGHVAALTWESVRNELQQPGSRFIHP